MPLLRTVVQDRQPPLGDLVPLRALERVQELEVAHGDGVAVGLRVCPRNDPRHVRPQPELLPPALHQRDLDLPEPAAHQREREQVLVGEMGGDPGKHPLACQDLLNPDRPLLPFLLAPRALPARVPSLLLPRRKDEAAVLAGGAVRPALALKIIPGLVRVLVGPPALLAARRRLLLLLRYLQVLP